MSGFPVYTREKNMKKSIQNQCRFLIAAVLLSTCISTWAAPTGRAQATPPNETELLREAQRLDDEGSWAEATITARMAMEAGRESTAINYVDLDAGDLLVNLLYKQGRYVETRKAAEERIAYWELKEVSFGRTGRRDPRILRMLAMAIEASMMAGERTEVARLQEKLFEIASPYPDSWHLAPDEPRLRYKLADFSMPLMLGQWKLVNFDPVDSREYGMYARYTQMLDGSEMTAEIFLSYEELQRAQSAAQRQEWIESYQRFPTAPAFALPMPDLPFDGLPSVKVERKWGCKSETCVGVHWITLHGDWKLDVDITFHSPDRAKVAEQLRQLFAALKWPSAPVLFRDRTMAEQIREMDSHWKVPGGWSKAAELAEQALPDAFFREEIARVHAYLGVAQYRRGDLDAASRSLGLALSGWEYVPFFGTLYEVVVDFAADLAYRQGRDPEAIAWNRDLIDWQDDTFDWGVPSDENALVHNWNGVKIPLRVGDYRLRLGTANRFFYENLQTHAQIGLAVGSPQANDDELEALLRAFMTKNLRLFAGEIRKTNFSPKNVGRTGHHFSKKASNEKPLVTGRKWEFEVTKLPDDEGASAEKPIAAFQGKTPRKMMFWIVARDKHRSILRAPITDGDQSETAANEIAQALTW